VKKEELVQQLSQQIKLVRTEFGYTQEEMSEKLGISKKTLVQIEKGRQKAGWTQVVALCALFQQSSVLQNALGGDPLEVVQTIAFTHYEWHKPKTLGGKVWWIEKKRIGGFVLQQNIISRHYRILDSEQRRWYSSFDREYIYDRFAALTEKVQKEK
jgi:DNA-binding XRE family transcriptional regulator